MHTEEHSSDAGFVEGLDRTCKRKKGIKDNSRIWGLILAEGGSGAIFGHVTFESLLDTLVEISRGQLDKYLSVEFQEEAQAGDTNWDSSPYGQRLKPETGSDPPGGKYRLTREEALELNPGPQHLDLER